MTQTSFFSFYRFPTGSFVKLVQPENSKKSIAESIVEVEMKKTKKDSHRDKGDKDPQKTLSVPEKEQLTKRENSIKGMKLIKD